MPSTATRPRLADLLAAVICLVLASCGGGSGGAEAGVATVVTAPAATLQEQQCLAAGWQRTIVTVAGVERVVLWKAPPAWTRGAIVVLHGGGGSASNFCVANVALIAAQVRFTDQALAAGHAVFVPDSTDRVTDSAGRLCGKVWDDEPRPRENLDLPLIEHLLATLIPAQRPAGSRSEVFMTGLSSGGYMTVRAAARLGARLAGFAPVASGDPFGWQRDCSPLASDRSNVFGYAFDVDSRLPIGRLGACEFNGDARERPWDDGAGRPTFRLLHHRDDGIHDLSCVMRVRRQLLAHGFAERAAFVLGTGQARSAELHYWQDAYNAALLDFFDELLVSRPR